MEGISIHYTGYKFDSDVATGYAFYAEREPVCEVAIEHAKPSIVTVSGPKSSWNGEYNADVTRVLGMTRTVWEAGSKREVFRLKLENFFITQIVRGTDILDVKEEKHGYAFFRHGEREHVALVVRAAGNVEWKPKLPGLLKEPVPYFDAHFTAKLDSELTLAILAYPMLKFT